MFLRCAQWGNFNTWCSWDWCSGLNGGGTIELIIGAMINAIAPLLLQDARPTCGTDAGTLWARLAQAEAHRRELRLELWVVASTLCHLALRHATQGALTLVAVVRLVRRPHGVFDVAEVARAVALGHALHAVPCKSVRTRLALLLFLLGKIRTQVNALDRHRCCRRSVDICYSC